MRSTGFHPQDPRNQAVRPAVHRRSHGARSDRLGSSSSGGEPQPLRLRGHPQGRWHLSLGRSVAGRLSGQLVGLLQEVLLRHRLTSAGREISLPMR